MEQIQRGFLLRVIKGYRTISNEAAQIICAIEPLYLTGLMIADVSNMKRGRRVPDYLAHLSIETPENLIFAAHPSLHIEIMHHSCRYTHYYTIFTDGSRFEETDTGQYKVGCAYVVYKDLEEIDYQKFRLSSTCTVFQAELLAIRESIQWCFERNVKYNICIKSDSQSAIQSIVDNYNMHPIAYEIRQLISKYSSHICISWIRGHSGDIGNEKADELAKLAANSELNVSYTLCPVSCIKRILKKRNLEKWNEKWIKSNNGKVTRDLFFSTVFNRLQCKSFVPDYILTQFLTGHGKF